MHPAARLRWLCNARHDDGDAWSARLRSSCGRVSNEPFSRSMPTMSHLPPTHHESSNRVCPNRITQFVDSSTEMHQIQIQTKSKSTTHHTNKPRHKPLGFSISPLMSTLTTPNAWSLNFGLKIKWSTIEWHKIKEKLKKCYLEGENCKTQELARKQQMTSRTK
jgi:hypothetical protein